MRNLVLLFCLFFIHHSYADTNAQRLITIGGAVTEIVFKLDKGDLIVGSDTTSYFPEQAANLPKVGYQRALSAEGILSLNPDLVILTNEAGPKPVLAQIKATNTDILQIKAGRSFEDVIENIKLIAKAIGADEKATLLVKKLESQQQQLAQKISAENLDKKIMFILQHGGGAPMVAGKNTAADSIITLAGANNSVSAYEGYKPLTPEAAITQAPDIILITEQGLEQAGGEASLLKSPGLALTPAGKNGHIIAMDSLLLLGFGPRTIDAAKELRQRFMSL